MSLTDMTLRARKELPVGKNYVDIYDGGGLLARFSKGYTVTFYYRFRYNKKPAIMKIGVYPEVSLKVAREKHSLYKSLLDAGEDPRQIVKKEKVNKIKSITVKDGIYYWYENYLVKNNKVPHKILLHLENHIIKHIGDVKYNDVNTFMWADVCKKCKGQVLATKILAIMKQCTKYLMSLGMCDKDTISIIKSSYVGKPSKPRDMFFSISELKDIYNYIHDNVLPTDHVCVLMVLMFMGARSGEVREISVNDLDFDKKIWTVPKEKSKSDRAILRPIPDFMIPYFKAAIDYSGHDKHVFVSRKNTVMTRGGFASMVQRVIERSGVNRGSPHIFRHTLSTSFGDLGIEPYIAEKILGHALGGVMGVYNKGHYLSQQLEAMEIWFKTVTEYK
ncbi:tyrosine-type recombinase/integrase [Aliivibrio fischeri]|uniref:tyrosine-type recombinase/integrase n=1 Tax=Aliivibrio fischeri TaxID=668 RepID=UPI001F2B57EF|nr:site-specific integrase [Aliivibrio fischeri]MCE7567583.1 tyrosine-type recombinase/integrase [Aliivibrio fischeri]